MFINANTKCAIERVNKNAVYAHIPWTGQCLSLPQSQVYKNFVENVVDGFIFMSHNFMWSKQFEKHRKHLFEKTDVYHIMFNSKDTFEHTTMETVTIFCRKGKTSTTRLSFEKNQNVTIDVVLDKQSVNMHSYTGLFDDNLICINRCFKKQDDYDISEEPVMKCHRKEYINMHHQSETKYYELLKDARKIIPYKLIKDNKIVSLDDISKFGILDYEDTDLMKSVYYSIGDDENHKIPDKCKTLSSLLGCTPYTSNVFNIIERYNYIHELTNEIPEWFILKWKL